MQLAQVKRGFVDIDEGQIQVIENSAAMWAVEQAIYYACDHAVAASFAQMSLLQAAALQKSDIAEAVRAAAERRPAKFDHLAPLPPCGEPAFQSSSSLTFFDATCGR